MKTSQYRPLFSFTAALLPRRILASRSAALLILLVLVSAWLGQDASAATYVWTNSPNTSSTSATNTNSYVTNGGSAFAPNGFLGGGNILIYTNNYSQSSAQTFNFNNAFVTNSGLTITGYTNNVIFTNVGVWRFTTNGANNPVFTATNSTGTGIVYIYNTNTTQLLSSPTFEGNMGVYLNDFGGHSTIARTLTNNLGSLAINNFLVNAASSATIGGANGVSFTWAGTGTTTILGTIMVVNQTNTTGTRTNNGALIVSSGTINIATTNGANASSTLTNVDNSNLQGWNSGLVITNSGSVYVSAQNSLGRQAYNIKMGTTNGGTTTFGLFDSNSWATNFTVSPTLTNNFDIANSGTTATNVFKSVTNKALTLSGVISSSNTNGTIVFQGTSGTNVLAGANTFSNAVVVSNTTLMLSNASALGATNAGTTLAGTSGRLDLNGQTISGEALTLSNSSAPSLLNSSATAASWSGGVTLAAATTITNVGNITLSGSISGSSGLTKSGAGTLILSASNSYTGSTTLSGGTLELASLTGSAAGSASSVTVGNGATLLLSQSDQVNNNATVTLSGGTITRGSGVSEVFGNLNLTQASFLDFGTGTAGTMTFGTYTPSALLTINNFGSGNTLVFGSDLSSTINNTSYFSFSSGISSTWDSGASTFTITAIPEASTEIAALGLLALCASPLLRRKRAKVS